MNKSSLILKYFQKVGQLTIKNPDYCSALNNLFAWLVGNDKADSDITSRLLNLKSKATVKIISKEKGIIAGLDEVSYLIKNHTSLACKPHITDGKAIKNDQTIAEISGNAREVLAYERTILNILQRMSGIATGTNFLIKTTPGVKEPELPHTFIAATRKTPWMQLDKKAVAVGGGLTHRLNLTDGILIKDNHLKVLQKQYKLKTTGEAIEKALKTHREWAKHSPGVKEPPQSLIEIEVETPHQAYLVMEKALKTLNHPRGGVAPAAHPGGEGIRKFHLAIMFDNFSPIVVKETLNKLRQKYDISSVIFEASGGITCDNIADWAKTGVDIISVGTLTHSPKAVNLSLEIL